ncbi:nuclear transport factor 2 family protein [Nakamurella flava]|uniref:Nuclear transport factor 2 family protein n=1 Tax=Nakamurella flava TaxID=2576308 RepID=A0A4U6QKP5_9ACTN|nr:nuclear transport factor 2 family protein [Nakamurella flava]TKV61033.1 nuclear transport factor 2 family protein [Nakamurella flava]
MTIALLREMFSRMVEGKDATLIERYYDPSLQLFTNGQVQDYEAFSRGHRTVYDTPITYRVEYDEQAWVQDDRRRTVAARVWITTARPQEEPTRIEVVLIAEYTADGRIRRIWETTYPGWEDLPAFEDY